MEHKHDPFWGKEPVFNGNMWVLPNENDFVWLRIDTRAKEVRMVPDAKVDTRQANVFAVEEDNQGMAHTVFYIIGKRAECTNFAWDASDSAGLWNYLHETEHRDILDFESYMSIWDHSL